jgi:hypothetical protein
VTCYKTCVEATCSSSECPVSCWVFILRLHLACLQSKDVSWRVAFHIARKLRLITTFNQILVSFFFTALLHLRVSSFAVSSVSNYSCLVKYCILCIIISLHVCNGAFIAKYDGLRRGKQDYLELLSLYLWNVHIYNGLSLFNFTFSGAENMSLWLSYGMMKWELLCPVSNIWSIKFM